MTSDLYILIADEIRAKRDPGISLQELARKAALRTLGYDPDQPRDEAGRFGEGGAGGEIQNVKPSPSEKKARDELNSYMKSDERKDDQIAGRGNKRELELRKAVHDETAKTLGPQIEKAMTRPDHASPVAAESYIKGLDEGEYVVSVHDQTGAPRVGYIKMAQLSDSATETRPSRRAEKIKAIQFLDKDTVSRPYQMQDRVLIKTQALGLKTIDRKAFDPNQPRDESGRFGEGGVGGVGGIDGSEKIDGGASSAISRTISDRQFKGKVSIVNESGVGWDDPTSQAIAAYDPIKDQLLINADAKITVGQTTAEYWRISDEERTKIAERLSGIGRFSTADPMHPVLHEIAHSEFYKSAPSLAMKAESRSFSDNELDLVIREVSKSAGYNGGEFVAEVSVGLRSGKSYSEPIRKLYSEITKDAMRSKT